MPNKNNRKQKSYFLGAQPRRPIGKTGILTLATLIVSAGGHAAPLEEVLVTAQKRAQSLQDVPISVQALTGKAISDAGIQNIEDLSAYMPNLKMTESAVGNSVFIRGIGSGINNGFEQSVGMFVNGLYAGRSQQFRTPFLDVERVEVLKGPQGTLFGKNTIAGAINISTRKPGDEFEGTIIVLGDADHGERETSLVISGPVTDSFGLRFVAQARNFDGYLKNTISEKNEAARKEEAFRLTANWEATDYIEVTAIIDISKFDVDGRAIQVSDISGEFVLASGTSLGQLQPQIEEVENGVVDDKKTNATFPGLGNETITDTGSAVFNVNWDIGQLTLTSISGISRYEFDESGDVDFTSLKFIHNNTSQEFQQVSQEVRIASPGLEFIDYIAGVYWQQQTLKNLNYIDLDFDGIKNHNTILPTPVPLAPYTVSRYFDQESETLAAFAEGTINFTDSLALTLGLRYSIEDKQAVQNLRVSDFRSRDRQPNPGLEAEANAVTGSYSHDYEQATATRNTSPSMNLQYDYNNDIMIYTRYAKGFKSGGFNEAETSGDQSKFEFEFEEADTIEIGSKSRFLDNSLEINANIFYSEFKNRQVSAFDGGTFVVGNAAASTTQGAELDSRYSATEKLSFNVSMAYLDSYFDEFTNAGCTAEQSLAQRRNGGGRDCSQDLTDADTEFSAQWSSSASIIYRQPISQNLTLRAKLDINYTDDYFYAQDLDDEEFTKAHTLFNGTLILGHNNGSWEVTLIGKNLTNEIVKVAGNDIPVYLGSHFTFTNRPRSLALRGTYRF
jgi:iron complex outermembrane receptor protein